jgi:membrane-associated phospholipid phosphatase
LYRSFQIERKNPKISSRRLLWLAIILVVLALYLPINLLVKGGTQLQLPVDNLIPFFPPAITIYLFADIIFVLFPVLAAIKVKRGEFEAYAVSILFASLISYIIYVIAPTFITRPEITGNDIFSKAVAILYSADRSNNAAPSGHTYQSFICAIYLWRWSPGLRWLWITVTILILASTLFTKQHYILDLVAGLAIGVLAYFFGRYATRRWNLSFGSTA